MNKKQHSYKKTLYELRVELSKLSDYLIHKNARVCVLFEGRDAAGKDGTIKRMLKYMPSRHSRMIALAKPTERELKSWYFQRYIFHLPVQGEIVFFNRSWYNRAIVEPVMSFCTEKEYKKFIKQVAIFETQLVQDGFIVIKYWLDIDKEEQKRRLDHRIQNILTKWKFSSIDAQAQKLWNDYTYYRDQMLKHTHHEYAKWTTVNFNHKKSARLALIRNFLQHFSYPNKKEQILTQDEPLLVHPYSEETHQNILSS